MANKITPANIYLETTNFCNAKCTMCPNEKMVRAKGIMTWETFKKVVSQIKCMSHSETTIFMHKEGEPLLDKNIVEKIEYLKSEIPEIKKISMNTNGSLLDSTISKGLINSGLDTIFFSLDSSNKKSYEAVRLGLEFETVVKNIEEFISINKSLDNRVHVVLQMLTNNLNSSEVDQYKEKWESYGVEIFIKSMHNYLDVELSQLNITKSEKQLNSCLDPFDTTVVYWNGDVGACCWDYNNIHDMGNINTASLHDIFNGDKFNTLRDRMTMNKANEINPCSRCLRVFGYLGIAGTSSEDGEINRQE